jgi:peptidoglycan hydrolase-like protein with peptidoglycan-binding domain
LPAWRDFEIGMEPGTDVLQLKENLVALGYGNFKNLRKDNVFDDETSRVISRMQSSLGLTTNGSLSFGEVIFMPGSSVIGSNTQFPQTGSMVTDKTTLLTLTPLQGVNTTIMSNGDVVEEATSLQRVSTQIDVADQTLVVVGTNVKIELPNDQLVDGRVASVGDVAIVPSGNQAGNPYLEVTIDLVGTEDLQQWTGASVVVSVTESVASNVLSAPITGLLALLGGGYALEVAENTGTRLVAVELGVYADNWVEISGNGLDENTLVVIPK